MVVHLEVAAIEARGTGATGTLVEAARLGHKRPHALAVSLDLEEKSLAHPDKAADCQ